MRLFTDLFLTLLLIFAFLMLAAILALFGPVVVVLYLIVLVLANHINKPEEAPSDETIN